MPDRDVPAPSSCATASGGPAAWVADTIEYGPRRVVNEPLGVVCEGDQLAVRA